MSGQDAILSLVTLGVSDLARSIAFYEALGFRRKVSNADSVGFFQAGAVTLAIWPVEQLALDANAIVGKIPTFRGVALAWNCRSQDEVDAVIFRAGKAGAKVSKIPKKTDWGGYAGYFSDPDGHLWEVAHNPHWPLSADGRMTLPD